MKNRILKHVCILFALLGMYNVSTIQAQDEKAPATAIVEADVLNQSGEPIPGIFVMSFVTNDKAITDAEGNFSLKVASDRQDQIIIETPGYRTVIQSVFGGVLQEKSFILYRDTPIDSLNVVSLPYKKLESNRSVSATYTITGEELASYPSTSFLEALSGRMPGLVIHVASNTPGEEASYASIRGEMAVIYIDGIERDPSDLSVYEVKSVQLIKDLSGSASLGLSGAKPVIWIETKAGDSYNEQINVNAEWGVRMPTVLPKYLRSADYATLYNEALTNDGFSPLYSAADITAYENGTDPSYHPDIDYYGDYVAKSAPYRRANVNFTGGDDRVNYFSMLDYVGTGGLEAVGRETTNDRFKIRGSANIKINDMIRLSVNLSGTYGTSMYANEGSGATRYNLFNYISSYPSNAHTMMHNGNYIISDDYPSNIENELVNGGFARRTVLNTQNTAILDVDLGDFVEGLTFKGTASFDVYGNIVASKGGTAALYRLYPDSVERIVEEAVDPDLGISSNDFLRRTVGYAQLNYDREFGVHALSMNATYLMGLVEGRVTYANYQPAKMQDVSYRVNYAYDNRYVLQLDLAYTGSMKLPQGDKFNFYPAVGAGWILSNESFLSNSSKIDYLKMYTSFGIMGYEDFTLEGYNPYFLHTTLWYNGGSWAPGTGEVTGESSNVYYIQQNGSEIYDLPKRSYFNLGIQGEMLDRMLSVELNYFYQKNFDNISQKASYTPSIYGTGSFLPATNFGSDSRWGVDGYVNLRKSLGDLNFNFGVNAMYLRGKYIEVDEPLYDDEYRLLAGKDNDLFWLYEAEGLFASDADASSAIPQSWGAVQEGDIQYVDYNTDGVVDEKDIHTLDEYHAPRLFLGLNLSLEYKGLGLNIWGQGVADGYMMMSNSRYFWINGTNQNYSELMLDRYPQTMDYPRLTTSSNNNYQRSTFWLKKAGYLRIKSVELSYTLPAAVSKKMLLRDCKIFLRTSNLAVFSSLNQYSIDPENYSNTSDYPLFNTISGGVSCKF